MSWMETVDHRHVGDGVFVALEAGECDACGRSIRPGDYVKQWSGMDRWAHERCRDLERQRRLVEEARAAVVGETPSRIVMAQELRIQQRRRQRSGS